MASFSTFAATKDSIDPASTPLASNDYERSYPKEKEASPPSYEHAVAPAFPSEYAEPVHPTSQLPTAPDMGKLQYLQQKQQPDLPNHPVRQTECRDWFWASIADMSAWSSCFYFMIVGFSLAVFELTWVITTLATGIACMVFPFVGVWLWIPFVYSWRYLGVIELVCLDMCGAPYHRNDPRKLTYRRPRYPSAALPPRQGRTFFGFVRDLSFDRFTVTCALYFIFVNLAYTAVAFVIATSLFCLSPTICFLPVCAVVCKQMGIWKIKMTHAILVGESGRSAFNVEQSYV